MHHTGYAKSYPSSLSHLDHAWRFVRFGVLRMFERHVIGCSAEFPIGHDKRRVSSRDASTRQCVRHVSSRKKVQRRSASSAGHLFDTFELRDVLAPIKGLHQPYFFVGASVTAGMAVVGQGGFDVVWDLAKRQSAVFWYRGGGVASLGGIEVGAFAELTIFRSVAEFRALHRGRLQIQR